MTHFNLMLKKLKTTQALEKFLGHFGKHGFGRALKGLKGHWLQVLVSFVTKSALGNGYLILDDTLLEKYTHKLACVFKLKDSKTGNYVYGLNIVLE